MESFSLLHTKSQSSIYSRGKMYYNHTIALLRQQMNIQLLVMNYIASDMNIFTLSAAIDNF